MTYPRTLSGTLGHASIMLRHNRHGNQNRCYVSFQIHEQGQNTRQTEYVPISQHTTQRTVLKTRNREGSVSSANRPYLRCKLGQPGAIQMSSQNNTYIEQATYTLGTDADPCTYKICPSGTVSKLKLEFTSLILTAPAGKP